MKIVRIRYSGTVVAAVLALTLLSGCFGKDAASYVASAKGYLAKSDYKAAIIEIKNALQKDPNNTEARIMLATSLLESGDPVGAETEIRKAIALRASDERTYPLLARSLAAQGQFKKLVSEVGDRKIDDPRGRSQLNVALAAAAFAQGNPAKGKELADAAIVDDPANVAALLLQAQMAGSRGDLVAARRFVETALKASPADVGASLMLGSLSLSDGKPDDARKTYEQALAAHPESIAVRSELLSLELKSGKLDKAKEQLAKMKETAPRDVRTVYADALLASLAGDNTHARDAIQLVLSVSPDNLPALLLSGLVNFQLRSYGAAEQSLRKVITRVPDEANARRVLALTYLRTGRPAEALETLDPALHRFPDNPVLLRTAGEAYLATGNVASAATSYERANSIDKNNVGSQVRLAQVRLAAGDTERAFSDLESLAARDPSEYQAELALFTEYMRRRQYDKALQEVDNLEKKRTPGAFVQNLRGSVYLAKRDLKSARAAFEKALDLDPQLISAAHNLAIIDFEEGSTQAAQARYDRMLAKDPKNEAILLAQAELLAMTEETSQKAKAVIAQAIATHPTSVRARLALIGLEERQKDSKSALIAAQESIAAIPNDPKLTEALGSTQLVAGQTNQAVETFRKLVQLLPQNPLALLRLAEAQIAVKDYNGAIESEKKALALKPNFPAALVSLTKTYLMSGRPEAAIAEARKLQKEQPDKAAGYALEGELLAAQRKWSEAARAFSAAIARQSAPVLTVRYYGALQNAGEGAEASAMAHKWIADHPQDSTIPLMLAEQSQRAQDLAAAKVGYQKVLEIDSNNIVALNNLAWILAEEKDRKGIEYAEQAHRLAPFNAGVLDTYGWALTRTGDAKRGVEFLRMASRIAPAQSEIRLHLAKALADSGDKAGAKVAISELIKLDKASPIRIEAEKLQATL